MTRNTESIATTSVTMTGAVSSRESTCLANCRLLSIVACFLYSVSKKLVFITVAQKVTRDCTLAIRIPNLLGDSVLRDCTLHFRVSNPQSLRRQHAKRLHIAHSNPQSLRGQRAKRLHIALSSLEPPIS